MLGPQGARREVESQPRKHEVSTIMEVAASTPHKTGKTGWSVEDSFEKDISSGPSHERSYVVFRLSRHLENLPIWENDRDDRCHNQESGQTHVDRRVVSWLEKVQSHIQHLLQYSSITRWNPNQESQSVGGESFSLKLAGTCSQDLLLRDCTLHLRESRR